MDPLQTVQAWFERVWHQRDAAAIDELRTPDAASYGLGDAAIDNATWRRGWEATCRAFSTTRVVIDEAIVQANTVGVRGRFIATVADTGQVVTARGIGTVVVVDGKIRSADNVWDVAEMASQLGFAKGSPPRFMNELASQLLARAAAAAPEAP